MRRDHQWITRKLDFLLSKYFPDIKLVNPIEIKFGREAKFRFGSIKLFKHKHFWGKPQKSIITITSMFAKEKIPAKVVEYTICHELCHYVHGFSSSNKRMFKYPHHGGIVNKELLRRGAGDLTFAYKKWLKNYRNQILKKKISL